MANWEEGRRREVRLGAAGAFQRGEGAFRLSPTISGRCPIWEDAGLTGTRRVRKKRKGAYFPVPLKHLQSKNQRGKHNQLMMHTKKKREAEIQSDESLTLYHFSTPNVALGPSLLLALARSLPAASRLESGTLWVTKPSPFSWKKGAGRETT